MKTQDAVDLFTPLILIPVYWLLFQVQPGSNSGAGETLLFMALAALWVEGQGIHLAANSIGHLTEAFTGSDAAALIYVYDEVFSHYLWHAGIIGQHGCERRQGEFHGPGPAVAGNRFSLFPSEIAHAAAAIFCRHC